MNPLSIFNSSIKRSVPFLLVTFLIFLLIVLCFEMVLYRLGETIPYKNIIARQEITSERYSAKYFDTDRSYKVFGVKSRKPDIVALGNSRMLLLRQENFNNEKIFYIAAVAFSIS